MWILFGQSYGGSFFFLVIFFLNYQLECSRTNNKQIINKATEPPVLIKNKKLNDVSDWNQRQTERAKQRETCSFFSQFIHSGLSTTYSSEERMIHSQTSGYVFFQLSAGLCSYACALLFSLITAGICQLSIFDATCYPWQDANPKTKQTGSVAAPHQARLHISSTVCLFTWTNDGEGCGPRLLLPRECLATLHREL